ncbi:MAG: hypothetical protein Q8Q51_09800 [Lutibacter sp.]|nr:hypothetical protein [Lutibacter sp.]
MKAIKILSILFLSLITFSSCNDADLNVDNPDGNIQGGGLLDVKNTSINYVVGNPGPYSASIRVYQGEVKTTSIRVAKTFYSGSFVSNTVDNFKTIPVSGDQNSFVNYTFNFTEMIAGLKGANGSPLSANDSNYQIGDYWKFDYYVTTSEGERLNYSSTKATVSTRYAGVYKVLESNYVRIGVPSGNWNDTNVVIESVDANIYKHVGLAFWADQSFYFTVDNTTGKITILGVDPAGAAVTLNGNPIMTCLVNNQFTALNPCLENANKVTKNDTTGEDVLQLTVGYYTSGSGPREFNEKLIKLVD